MSLPALHPGGDSWHTPGVRPIHAPWIYCGIAALNCEAW